MENEGTWRFESLTGITLQTRDKESALRWYEKNLDAIVDWEYVSGSAFPEDDEVFTLPGLDMVFGVSLDDAQHAATRSRFSLRVRDPWAWHFRLKNGGVAVSQLFEGEDGDATFAFRDPDGNHIHLSNSIGDFQPLELEESAARDYYRAQQRACALGETIDDPYQRSELWTESDE